MSKIYKLARKGNDWYHFIAIVLLIPNRVLKTLLKIIVGITINDIIKLNFNN